MEDSKYYTANAATDTILYGDQLREGMEVLIEDTMLREYDTDSDSPYVEARRNACNYWCQVTGLRYQSGVLTFIGLYDDDTMRVRRYATSYAWIVKDTTIPAW